MFRTLMLSFLLFCSGCAAESTDNATPHASSISESTPSEASQLAPGMKMVETDSYRLQIPNDWGSNALQMGLPPGAGGSTEIKASRTLIPPPTGDAPFGISTSYLEIIHDVVPPDEFVRGVVEGTKRLGELVSEETVTIGGNSGTKIVQKLNRGEKTRVTLIAATNNGYFVMHGTGTTVQLEPILPVIDQIASSVEFVPSPNGEK